MKKNTKLIYISEAILLLYVIIFSLFINTDLNAWRNIATIVVLTVIFVILLSLFGYKKSNNYLKGSSARIVIASLLSYMLFTYSFGIILGFGRSYFVNNFAILFRNIMPILLINVLIELVRYMIASNSFKNVRPIVVFTILSIALNIMLEINLGVLNSAEDKFIFLSTIIFPIIAEEALCSYMTYKISFVPSMIYKLVLKLYVYIVPFVPNLGNYIYSVINIILPFILYTILSRMVIKYDKEKQELKTASKWIFVAPLLISFAALVLLISGVFRYKMVAIATNSMYPVYARGDAVIYEKVDVDKLEIGDIIAFQKDNIIVTHRIVKIWRQGEGYYFVTRGDNNNTNDTFQPTDQNYLGRVNFVVKYIGYPTVLINEIFGKE